MEGNKFRKIKGGREEQIKKPSFKRKSEKDEASKIVEEKKYHDLIEKNRSSMDGGVEKALENLLKIIEKDKNIDNRIEMYKITLKVLRSTKGEETIDALNYLNNLISKEGSLKEEDVNKLLSIAGDINKGVKDKKNK